MNQVNFPGFRASATHLGKAKATICIYNQPASVPHWSPHLWKNDGWENEILCEI